MYYSFEEKTSDNLLVLRKHNLDFQILWHWACNGVRMHHSECARQQAQTMANIFSVLSVVTTHWLTARWSETFVKALQDRVRQITLKLEATDAKETVLCNRMGEMQVWLAEIEKAAPRGTVDASHLLPHDLVFEPLFLAFLQTRKLVLTKEICCSLLENGAQTSDNMRALAAPASLDVLVQTSHILKAILQTKGFWVHDETIGHNDREFYIQDVNEALWRSVLDRTVNLHAHLVTQGIDKDGISTLTTVTRRVLPIITSSTTW